MKYKEGYRLCVRHRLLTGALHPMLVLKSEFSTPVETDFML